METTIDAEAAIITEPQTQCVRTTVTLLTYPSVLFTTIGAMFAPFITPLDAIFAITFIAQRAMNAI